MKPDTSHMILKEKIMLESFINSVDTFVNEYARVCDVKCEYSDMWQETTDDLANANELIKAYESEIASLEADCTRMKIEIKSLKQQVAKRDLMIDHILDAIIDNGELKDKI